MTLFPNYGENVRDLSRGFLPAEDPLVRLGEDFDAWEETGDELPKLVINEYHRRRIRELPPFPCERLREERELWRAGTLLAHLASLYVLGVGGEPVPRIPAVLAVPLVEVTSRLGIPPILSYALQAMYNWRRIYPAGPVAVGNLTLLNNFLGGMDEEWFVTLHINIEAVAGRALAALRPMQAAIANKEDEQIERSLAMIASTLQEMHDLLGRMTERCDPYVYYHRVRPFMFGWKDNSALPDGVVYEGVDAFGGNPMQFRGETGAQSGIIPALDAALGVSHGRDEMRAYLMEMRDYMPPKDRTFVEALEAGPSLRAYLKGRDNRSLSDAYNHCIEKLTQFRQRHVEYAALYILKPSRGDAAVGTGGTPFTYYLKKHVKETDSHLLRD